MQSNHMERMHMWFSLQKIENYCQKTFYNPVKSQLPPNCMEMMHVWSTFKLMVANPGRLWKMATIVTKNRFFFNFFYSLNIVKNQCCYQTIKEQCIYNSLSDHEWWPRLPSNMAVATSQTWKLVKKINKK